MTWYDVDDILYDGTKEEIEQLRCPECGGHISFAFYPSSQVFRTLCKKCGIINTNTGSPKPICAEIFGDEYGLR